jgi:hypothetical protein
MGGSGQMPPAEAAPTARRFIAVAVGIAACFMAVTAYSQSVQRDIDRDADDIAYNAAPTVERLSAARAELRHLEALLAPGRVNANLTAIGRSRSVFHDDIAEYLALPTFPGERERWDAVSAVLEKFEQVVSGVLAGDGSARAQLPATVDLASEAIAGSIEFNAAQARRLAIDIRMLHRIRARWPRRRARVGRQPASLARRAPVHRSARGLRFARARPGRGARTVLGTRGARHLEPLGDRIGGARNRRSSSGCR